MTRPARRRAGRLIAGSAAVLIGALLPFAQVGPAEAEEPLASGWWSQASGTPLSTAGVPQDGLFIQGDAQAPLAISAVSLDAAAAGGGGRLALKVAGQAVLTAAPLACRATSAFLPTYDGSWADRPTYDCSQPVTAIVSDARTTVTFDLPPGPAWVLLAGGTPDRVAFAPPDAAAVAARSPAPTTAEPHASPAAVEPAPPSTQIGPLLPPVAPAPVLTQAPSPPLPTTMPPPAVAPAQAAQQLRTARAVPAGRTWPIPAGLLVLVGLILYWSDGFGALDLRRRIPGHG